MQTVDIYIGTSLRGRAKGVGRVIYIMWTKLQSGKEKESRAEVAEYDNVTESSLVLYAVRAAMFRMNFACRIVIHTECEYVAAAINQNWPEIWRQNNWKNSKGKEVKDSMLWGMILQEIEESGHELEANRGKHTWSEWMRWTIPLTHPLKENFTKIEKDLQN